MTRTTDGRILVTGATGFLGRHIVPALREQTGGEVVGVGRRGFDLLEAAEARRMLEAHRPDRVVHLAARVGGILANLRVPADLLYENLLLNAQVLDACRRAGVRRVLTLIGGCSYPADARSPIHEDAMWDGFPQPELGPYAAAKRMVLVHADALQRQHGLEVVVLVVGNAYGEHDRFSFGDGHVVPALIRRFVEAREAGLEEVTCYGTGRPVRDFVYAGDVARLVPWFLAHDDGAEPVNVSSGVGTSIRELAETIARLAGYDGRIAWDTTKPDGKAEKVADVGRLAARGLRCDTPLEEGLRRTIAWFEEARRAGEVRL